VSLSEGSVGVALNIDLDRNTVATATAEFATLEPVIRDKACSPTWCLG
jgi:hypothetical protein